MGSGNIALFFNLQQLMEVSGQIDALATLETRKHPALHNVTWAPKPVWML
jgi:hypothetical protein